MHDQFFQDYQAMLSKGVAFATALVVRREAPSSGKPGDKAVITAQGHIRGWIGGGCVQGIVAKEACDAIRSGQPRLVRIGKKLAPKAYHDGTVNYTMTCQSEGTVEIFIESVQPPPHLVVIGKSEIAKALVSLAGVAGYRITAVATDANLKTFTKVHELITQLSLGQVKTTKKTMIVVATQGDNDEKALVEALSSPSAYLGFVASRKKMVSIRQYLLDAGHDEAAINRIHAPAGLDLNAKKPFEVAISILAELVELQNNSDVFQQTDDLPTDHQPETAQEEQAPRWYINPVCGVPVNMNSPKHTLAFGEETVYFCCDGCKVKFEADPEKYMRMRALGMAPEGM